MPSLQLVTASDALIDGKYRLLDVIGSGGVGTVYRAKHVWTEREVAVKVLHSNLPHLAELRAAFLREARAAVRLEHPNVVDVLDMGEDALGTTYMVMELLEGPTLRDVLTARGSLSSEETIVVLAPLIDALEKAHQVGIVHKDFKPENIILTTSTEGAVVPTLLDFGVAQILQGSHGDSGPEQVLIGTPQYMSPEQARGQRDRVGPHSDVWGVGVVWYECLTGECPFDGDTHGEALDAVVRGTLELRGLPEPHSGLLEGMLRRRIDERTPNLSTLRDQMIHAGIIERARRDESASFRLPASGARPSRILETLHGVGPFERKRSSSPETFAARTRSADAAEDEELPQRRPKVTSWAGVGLVVVVALATWWSTRGNEGASEAAFETDVTAEAPSRPNGVATEPIGRELVEVPPSRVQPPPYEVEEPGEETTTPSPEPAPTVEKWKEAPSDAQVAAEEPAVPTETAAREQDDEAATPSTTASRRTGARPPGNAPERRAREAGEPSASKSYRKPPDLVTEW